MIKPDESLIKRLERLNATYRVVVRAGSSGVACEIIDRTTGTAYAESSGSDEAEAVALAVAAAENAPKPLTPAQAYDKEMGRLRTEATGLIAEKNTTIAQQEAALAEKNKLLAEQGAELERLRKQFAETETPGERRTR